MRSRWLLLAGLVACSDEAPGRVDEASAGSPPAGGAAGSQGPGGAGTYGTSGHGGAGHAGSTSGSGGLAGHGDSTAGAAGGGGAGSSGSSGQSGGGASQGAGGAAGQAGSATAGAAGQAGGSPALPPSLSVTGPVDGWLTAVRQVIVSGSCTGPDVVEVRLESSTQSVVARQGAGAVRALVIIPLGPSKIRMRCTTGEVANEAVEERSVVLGSPVAVGLGHSLWLAKDGLRAAGENGSGQLGVGSTTAQDGAVTVPLAQARWLSASGSASAAVTQDGAVWLWGALAASSLPASIAVDGPAVAVSLGGAHGLVLMADGTVRAFGLGSQGQLGTGSTASASKPTEVPGLTGIVRVAAGSAHSVALRADGAVFVWGSNQKGALGDGQTDGDAHPVPQQVGLVEGAVDVAAGRDHVLALLADGSALGWGAGSSGQLGTGQSGILGDRAQPVPVSGLTDGRAVFAAGNASFALRATGEAVAWGQNSLAQLGVGDTTARTTPTPMVLGPGVTFVGPGTVHGLATMTGGAVVGWGVTSSGELGTMPPSGGPSYLLTPRELAEGDGQAGWAGGSGQGGSSGTSGQSGASGASGAGTSLEPAPFEPGEDRPGGGSTADVDGQDAFARPSPLLDPVARSAFLAGEALFAIDWIPAPGATPDRDGLGPLYNATSCAACHFRAGRGAPPPAGQPALALLVRLSRAATGSNGEPLPEPTYGDQIQPRAVAGVTPEAQVLVAWSEQPGTMVDGTAFSLLSPQITLSSPGYGPLAADVLMSPRVASPLHGGGLLEAVTEGDIVALADPDDTDGDGISGRPNRLPGNGTTVLGRFGWKANQPTLHQQAAVAFRNDLGLTSPDDPDEACTEAQQACMEAPNGGTPELTASRVEAVAVYNRALAVPSRPEASDAEVLAGKGVFHATGCASCHHPSFTTGLDAARPWLSGQTIWPYTDLLLHDMGPGLADGRPDHLATGTEWRTPPLWGLGRTKAVSGHTRLLHDGRARSAQEAILWHGGEAQKARESFGQLGAAQRQALLRFLDSL